MIQRKQTLFLLLATILTVICLCLPLGSFTDAANIGKGTSTLYNLWLTTPDGGHIFPAWVLFAILLLTCPIAFVAIFTYHNRIVQSRLCMFNMLLVIGWYVVFAVFALNLKEAYGEFSLSFTSVFPAVAVILYFMARKAILADEALVKAADRIR